MSETKSPRVQETERAAGIPKHSHDLTTANPINCSKTLVNYMHCSK